ncbi:MAG: TetR/AcrR family transcriptional regulator [Candidatus Rokubacteria bacterium]|nr:TetR/AcrR family transcriptional regulator [Candidatus Rokubacteria bacterium]
MTTQTTARPRDGRSTREAVLEAATRLIHLKGYRHTTLDDVLSASGVGKGNFYHYFKSKEDLGFAILDRFVDAFKERALRPAFSDPEEARIVQVRRFLARVRDVQHERNCVGGCVFGNLAAELADVHEGFRERLAGLFSHWCQHLGEVLADGQRRGEVSEACRPEAAAQFIVASLEGAMLLTKLTKDIAVMDRCVEEMNRYLSLYETAR